MRRANIDPEMLELIEVLGSAIVPRSRRKAAVRVDTRAPYYSRSRYRRF